jgi:uncharacterized damage-inducible protein DinB
MPEPWLRGTLTGVPAVTRAVVHSLHLAQEDLSAWCEPLNEEEMNAHPAGLPSLAFHLRHIARSLDRLLTYAEGGGLSAEQVTALTSEMEPVAGRSEMFQELNAALDNSARRVLQFSPDEFEQPRTVGRLKLPTTLGGLLVHVAEHTQRHAGQAVITAKVLLHARSVKPENDKRH